ncbi:MAG: hypothetical protein ACD_5C00029G0004 [uncultured bacterium]|nr:MAG: hypothetical protein ACD_5C00029G0004 [uncultured bacterium]
MQKKQTNITIWIIAIFLIAVVASFFIPGKSQDQPKNLDSLAQCLKDKGAKFYGAFWCSHCNNQKKAFGDSQKLLPYIECSTPDGKGQTKECQDANIDGYPTWTFPDGSRQSGDIPLPTLAEKTGCQLP